MEQVTLRLSGASALIMHSDITVDPLHPLTQRIAAVAAVKKKTKEHHDELGRLEFEAGLYLNDDGPYLPAENIRKSLVEAARLSKAGKTIERGVMIFDDAQLDYEGPRDPAGLYAKREFVYRKSVAVGGRRVMRCRPIFPAWSAEVGVLFDPAIVEKRAVIAAATNAGQYIGIGERRPNRGGIFGRFTVEVVK